MMQSSAKLRELPANPLPADWKEWAPKEKEKYLSRLRRVPSKHSPILSRPITPTREASLAKYCPHSPWPAQRAFLELECEEAFYGGAAGPGKTDALLMAALEYVHVPGYAALILRRNYTRLSKPGAIMDRARQWLYNTDAKWSGKDHTFRFPSGAVIQFGFIDNPDDRFQFTSAEFQFIGWDELTEFRLNADDSNPYLFMFSRLRRTTSISAPRRVRSASNPGNIGHLFVLERFIPDDWNGESGIRWKEGRAFVPAHIKDNPAILEAEYVKSLMHLPTVTRERLLRGDWSIKEDSLLRPEWLRYYTTKGDFLEAREPLENKCVGSIDRRTCQRFATVDTAGTSKQKAEERKGKPASWSVAAIWEYWPAADFLFLRHVWRDRVDFTDLCGNVERMAREWGGVWHIENAHLGPALEAVLRRKGINVRSLPTVTKAMTGDSGRPGKVERSTPLQNRLEAGKLFLPAHETTWRPVLEGEWLGWTGLEEETADQIDVASYACDLVESDTGTIVFPKW